MSRFLIFSLCAFYLAIYTATSAHAEDEAAEPEKVTQYIEIKPAFVANFGGKTNRLKYVKADVSVRVNSIAAANQVESHFPLIRHEVVMLLSSQPAEAMSSTAGQEGIRTQALDLVKAALEEETGSSQIEDLLFTTFVVQH